MADVKKMVENLAKEAGIAAKGESMICECTTCREAVEAAEQIIEELCRAHCAQAAWAVLAIAACRVRTTISITLGTIQALHSEMGMLNETAELGMQWKELAEHINRWQEEIIPQHEPEVPDDDGAD